MSKINWRRAAAVWLGGLAAASALPAQEGPKAAALPAGPTLVFDAETKEYHATAEEASALFTFHATNVWTNTIVIQAVYASCHCTVATLPANPWVLLPGAGGAVTARVDLTDQEEGTVTKTLTFFTSVGERVLTLKVATPPPLRPPGAPLTEAERKAAMGKAAADARAIFKGDCATCHVDKARGLLGKELYAAACGICHDSPRRASFVPDLRALKQPTDLDYWKTIITRGKPHTIMPGFASAEGGPLSEMQVSSLAAYLDKTMAPHAPAR
ncbi:MAG: c-type cytochrome [Verrucomicrobiota bacterium]|jgi:mono/diheme cytochrome c family protein